VTTSGSAFGCSALTVRIVPIPLNQQRVINEVE